MQYKKNLGYRTENVYASNSTRCMRSVKDELLSENVLNSCSFDLDCFLGPSSGFMFQLLQLGVAFLNSPITSWSDLPSLCTTKDVINSLTVVNASAEREITLVTKFISIITKQEVQKQVLFQVAESHRQMCPDATRKRLFKPKLAQIGLLLSPAVLNY